MRGNRSNRLLVTLAFLAPLLALHRGLAIGTGVGSFVFGLFLIVQIGFVALFWSFRRRAKELQRHREQFHVVNGGVR